MFRSSGPRARRPTAPAVPSTHAVTRRETEVLRSVQLIVAAADPSGDVGTTRRERTIRRRHEILEYLRLQGGEVRDPAGLVTRHLRVALGAGPELSHLLRALEHEGRILREVRGRRTYAIRLAGTAPSTGTHAEAAASLDATPDFATFALAIVEMLDKRLAVADPDDRARVERLERERTAMRRDLAAYRAAVTASLRDFWAHGGGAGSGPDRR